MKKLIPLLLLVVLLTGCGKSSAFTANDYAAKLKDSGLTIGNVIVYTAENDVNKLMGRPNQYTSKVNFADTTLEQRDASNPAGGSVEVFSTGKDATARKDYIDNIGKSASALAEYSYINGTALLRLNKALTPDQAEKYKTAFMKIK